MNSDVGLNLDNMDLQLAMVSYKSALDTKHVSIQGKTRKRGCLPKEVSQIHIKEILEVGLPKPITLAIVILLNEMLILEL